MDELLKNCNDRLFKVGDKVIIRQDIWHIALLNNAGQERYSKLFGTNSDTYSIVSKNVNYAIQRMTDFLGGDK